MLINLLIVLFVLVLFVGAFLLIRTVTFPMRNETAQPVELAEIEAGRVAGHLAETLRLETISTPEGSPQDCQALLDLHARLEKMYPQVHASLKREVVGEYSLLYHWAGQQPDLPALLFAAHQDVVPVEETTLDAWQHPPFSGDIADGQVWGRGALDDKSTLITLLEAVEHLLEQDFRPQRDIYLAFGHDEELGGEGARQIAALLEERGVQLEAVLDEGGMITEGLISGVVGPVALIGTAEKGHVTLELSVEGEPGHSSTPPAQTAIGILSMALAHLEANPFPAHPERMLPMMRSLGSVASFGMQFAFANLWLTRRMVTRRLSANPRMSAIIRTTTAVTVFHGGVKENVLPARAEALVNLRLLPGDNIAMVCERCRAVIGDERVQLRVREGSHSEATPCSPIDTTIYRSLQQTIYQVFPNVTAVAPYLMLGASDARHYTRLCPQVYRFMPCLVDSETLSSIHGTNERIGVDDLGHMVQFFAQLMRTWSQAA